MRYLNVLRPVNSLRLLNPSVWAVIPPNCLDLKYGHENVSDGLHRTRRHGLNRPVMEVRYRHGAIPMQAQASR